MNRFPALSVLAVAALTALLLLPACTQEETALPPVPERVAADAPVEVPNETRSSGDSITRIEDVHPGAPVQLQGTVTRILDEDEFRMEDETGSIRVYIGWRNRVPVEVGEEVRVRGVVDDDLVGAFRPEVYASEIVRADGTVIQLTLDDD